MELLDGLTSATLCGMTDVDPSIRADDPTAALDALEEGLRDCRGCGLADGRTQVVFGAGSAAARLMFVGEGPGFHEDRQGIPFVGQAGKLLSSLLEQIGLTREEVYIANVIKCRPAENRDPTEEEIRACSPHLMRQIKIIRPQVVCSLGRFATRLLTGTELPMGAVHGRAKPTCLGGVDTVVFPVYHPAAALYAPANRTVLEEDFAKLRVLLERGTQALRGLPESEPASQAQEVPEAGSPIEASVEPPTVEPSPVAPTDPPSEDPPRPAGGGQAEQLPLW